VGQMAWAQALLWEQQGPLGRFPFAQVPLMLEVEVKLVADLV
jgi:hypothetical protein